MESFYFTEKILDCFVAMTLPIYLGATEIGNYFNKDGIITIKENELYQLDKILKQCSEKDYFSRLNAIKENYERVKQYRCMEVYLMFHYRKEFELD